ncbi:hypothetical protein [Palleronia pelagia]|uniref:Uncharacterized protein n=1 Tax=Palleronia pelagia TaxID=387096 RepID=A0A1H8KQ46_9RHOB|nr:hypothetical protein [Palleronia pelagia]SEN95019.1 hypothetical protein SAMN04488011_10883 [Palleronia pelagia]
MIHIFCEPDDGPALWLAGALSERDVPVEVSLPEELLVGSRFALELGGDAPEPRLTTASGVSLSTGNVNAIVARLTSFPVPPLENGSDADLVYAAEECRASLVGWFAAWACPMIGRPAPYTPWGDDASPREWRVMAASLGLPVAADHLAETPDNARTDVLATSGGCFVAGGEAAPSELADPASRLLPLQNDIAAVFRFVEGPDGPLFDGPVPMVDFGAFGPVVPDMLADLTSP